MAGANKKTRSANFTFDDQKRLIQLAKKHGSVIECKKTDKYSWEEKDAEWELLATEYNAGTSSCARTATVLKAKFKNMKKDFRKHKGQVRQSQYATGGGPSSEITPYPFEDDLSELLGLSAEGLFNPHDGDRAVGPKQNKAEKRVEKKKESLPESDSDDMDLDLGEVETEHDMEEIPVIFSGEFVDDLNYSTNDTTVNDWSTYTPAMLRKPKHPALVLPSGALLTKQAPTVSTAGALSPATPPCSPSTNLGANKTMGSRRRVDPSRVGEVDRCSR